MATSRSGIRGELSAIVSGVTASAYVHGQQGSGGLVHVRGVPGRNGFAWPHLGFYVEPSESNFDGARARPGSATVTRFNVMISFGIRAGGDEWVDVDAANDLLGDVVAAIMSPPNGGDWSPQVRRALVGFAADDSSRAMLDIAVDIHHPFGG